MQEGGLPDEPVLQKHCSICGKGVQLAQMGKKLDLLGEGWHGSGTKMCKQCFGLRVWDGRGEWTERIQRNSSYTFNYTIVLAIRLFVPRKSYTNTSMRQGRGNWPQAGMAGHREGKLIWKQSTWSYLRFLVLLVAVWWGVWSILFILRIIVGPKTF